MGGIDVMHSYLSPKPTNNSRESLVVMQKDTQTSLCTSLTGAFIQEIHLTNATADVAGDDALTPRPATADEEFYTPCKIPNRCKLM